MPRNETYVYHRALGRTNFGSFAAAVQEYEPWLEIIFLLFGSLQICLHGLVERLLCLLRSYGCDERKILLEICFHV